MHLKVTQLIIGFTMWFSQLEVCVTFMFSNFLEKDKECSSEWLVNKVSGFYQIGFCSLPFLYSSNRSGKYSSMTLGSKLQKQQLV